MLLEIGSTKFYAKGDERRFFQGLSEIEAITDVRGVGRALLVRINIRYLNREAVDELIALLWRYGISLAPLSLLAENKRFTWLRNKQFYWYDDMFSASADDMS